MGSPPHTCRIRIDIPAGAVIYRITSTYVENTLRPVTMYRTSRDHLHIRGEYGALVAAVGVVVGSPPHTWRIPTCSSCYSIEFRITSTYVENTFHQVENISIIKDHLHIRGEYVFVTAYARRNLGSPPHTWRIHVLGNYKEDDCGITSTYVENTNRFSSSGILPWDHLHIRGEYPNPL